MTITKDIRKFREEKGLTQKELGKRCGMSESTLRQYESGLKNPQIDTIKKIADVLEVPLKEILHIAEDGKRIIDLSYLDIEQQVNTYMVNIIPNIKEQIEKETQKNAEELTEIPPSAIGEK